MKMSAEVARGGALWRAASRRATSISGAQEGWSVAGHASGRRRDDGLLSCGGRLQYGRYKEVNSPIIGFPITGRNQ